MSLLTVLNLNDAALTFLYSIFVIYETVKFKLNPKVIKLNLQSLMYSNFYFFVLFYSIKSFMNYHVYFLKLLS